MHVTETDVQEQEDEESNFSFRRKVKKRTQASYGVLCR
jgi:hypothetical protein